jgi:rod shape-determining protein MreB
MNFLSNLDKREIGIDLGTANILVALKGKGIVLREPSVVALDKETKEILAFGNQAKLMLGRTPEKIDAIKPLKDGVIADYTATKIMLKSIVTKVCRKYKIVRPRVVVGVPSGITEVEKRAVEEAILSSGAGSVYLIDEPMAAAIGSGLNTSEPTGNLIVDIGGGTTEVAVISLGGIVVSESIKIAGDELTDDIINYAKRKLHIVIGEVTAENVKKQLACAKPLAAEETMEIRGRDTSTGLPVIREISSNDVGVAIQGSLLKIIDAIKACLEQTPPELLSDIAIRGIMVAGGGALIRNLDELIKEKTDTPVFIAVEPLDCVVKGTQKIVEDIKLKKVLG